MRIAAAPTVTAVERLARAVTQRRSNSGTRISGCWWLKFLERVTNGEPELQSFLQRIIGYSITGSTREHALFFLYGTGANGKKVALPESLVLYCARHTFGTAAYEATGNLAMVMKVMGHTDARTAMQYQHPQLDPIRDAIDERNSSHNSRHSEEMVQ